MARAKRSKRVTKNEVPKRRSTRIKKITDTNMPRVIDVPKRGKEPPRVLNHREPEPDHPIPYPLYWDTGRDTHAVKVKLTPKQQSRVLNVLSLVLQACQEHHFTNFGGLPSSLDRNHDLTWDWRTVELLSEEYGAFLYVVANCQTLRGHYDSVSYDWTPVNCHKGILSLRKTCGFQHFITDVMSAVIEAALKANKFLESLAKDLDLETRMRASVLTGTVEGTRSPSRCWRYTPKAEADKARPDDLVQDFVLEVGVGEKTKHLHELADSYIKRGTLCVMTVQLERNERTDFVWSYSIYRRGEERRGAGHVTTFEMVCAAQNVRVKAARGNITEFPFPVGLTLFDFVPTEVLKTNGVTHKKDKTAVLNLSIFWEELWHTEGQLPDCFGGAITVEKKLQELKQLLSRE